MSYQGYFLVAAPRLRDPNFFRSVVLLVRHNEEGAFGIVINRSSGKLLKEVWQQVSEAPCKTDESLYLGGPIQGPLMAVHDRQSASQIEVVSGLHFTADRDHLEQLVSDQAEPIRFIAGYAGWGSGQLESELDEGAWLTVAADAATFLEPVDELWEKLTRQIGRTSLLSTLKVKHVPPDPSYN